MAGTEAAIVTFDDILRRQVPLEWFECVAIVAELCAVLTSSDQQHVPSADRISLSASGVSVRGDSAGGDGTELARLLNTLLSPVTPPAPLRLFILHAASSETHKSVKHFGEALAYYERPGRTEIVRSAWERAIATPEPAADAPPPVDVEPASEEAAPIEPPARRGRGLRLAFAAILVCACVVSAAVLAPRWLSTADPSEQAGPLGRIGARLAEGAAGLAQTVRNAFAPAPAPQVAEEATGTVGVAARPLPVRVRRVQREIPVAESAAAGPAASVAAAAPDAPEGASAPLSVGDPGVYSAAVPDVTPPVLLDPRRVPAPPASRGSATTVIELLVNELGLVDHVKVVVPSDRITDMMLLSAAKTWMYEPARKDGRPVSYRLTFEWVTPTP